MDGPAREKAIAELKAEKKGFYGLEDPDPNTDLLQELGLKIPRPPVRYIMSAAAEAARERDDVDGKKCAAARRTHSLMGSSSTDSGGTQSVSDSEAGTTTDDESARMRADITCAAAARRRCVPRMPLRPNDAVSHHHREKVPAHSPCYYPCADEVNVYDGLEQFALPAKWMANMAHSACVARP